MEAKEIKVILEEDALKILKEVDAIHRNTLINIGLKLVQKTELFKTLTGDSSEEIQKIASLDNIGQIEQSAQKEEAKTEEADIGVSWDML